LKKWNHLSEEVVGRKAESIGWHEDPLPWFLFMASSLLPFLPFVVSK
jgi:hypothetical protein